MLGIVVWDWMIRRRIASRGFAGAEVVAVVAVVANGIEIAIAIASAMLLILLLMLLCALQ